MTATTVALCGHCNQPIPSDSPSLYFCDYWHQRAWYGARLRSDEDRRLADVYTYPYPAMGLNWGVA